MNTAAGTAGRSTEKRPITAEQFDFCNLANASSAETAMLAIATLYALAGLFFLLCARCYARDAAAVGA